MDEGGARGHQTPQRLQAVVLDVKVRLRQQVAEEERECPGGPGQLLPIHGSTLRIWGKRPCV